MDLRSTSVGPIDSLVAKDILFAQIEDLERRFRALDEELAQRVRRLSAALATPRSSVPGEELAQQLQIRGEAAQLDPLLVAKGILFAQIDDLKRRFRALDEELAQRFRSLSAALATPRSSVPGEELAQQFQLLGEAAQLDVQIAELSMPVKEDELRGSVEYDEHRRWLSNHRMEESDLTLELEQCHNRNAALQDTLARQSKEMNALELRFSQVRSRERSVNEQLAKRTKALQELRGLLVAAELCTDLNEKLVSEMIANGPTRPVEFINEVHRDDVALRDRVVKKFIEDNNMRVGVHELVQTVAVIRRTRNGKAHPTPNNDSLAVAKKWAKIFYSNPEELSSVERVLQVAIRYPAPRDDLGRRISRKKTSIVDG